jgi:acyl-CoA thioesterase-1
MTSRFLLSLCLVLTACGEAGAGGSAGAATRAGADTSAPSLASHPAPSPPPEDTYVSRVAELADSAGLPIRTVNAGVSGATSADGLSRIGWVLKDPLDILVLELGANDGLRGQDPRATQRNLLAIIDSTRAHYPHARIVLAGMEAPPNLGAAYTQAFRAVFPRVARERHTALIPFLLQGVGGVRALNQADGIHPNAEGERIVAHNVWKVLEPIVRDVEAHGPASEGR